MYKQYRYVSSGAIDAGASIIQGQGVESHVVACAFTHVNVVARDKWGNSHFHQRENLVGVVVGGGAINGSGAVFQETIVVLHYIQTVSAVYSL